MTPDSLRVTYQLELPSEGFSAEKLQAAARQIAVGQTIGTHQATEVEMLRPYMAEVYDVQEVQGELSRFRRALIQVAFPVRVVESDLGALQAVVFGKLSMAGRVRLVDLDIPPSLAKRFQGPRYGVQGIRELTGVAKNNPLLMAIFKPCLGLPPETLGAMMRTLAEAGINLVKDDEVLADTDFDSARRRLESVLSEAQQVQADTGHKVLYAINLSGPAEELLDRARGLVAEGASALLVNYLAYGLPLLNALRRTVDVPLVAHPSLAGAFYGSPAHGISPQVLFGTLPRLAGADLVLFPSPYGSVALPAEEAQAVRNALLKTHAGLCPAFPVPSAGIQADMVPRIIADFGTDVVINAGTGIHEHPDGSAAGTRQFKTLIAEHAPQQAQASR